MRRLFKTEAKKMRRSKTISLAEAMNDYIREMNLGGKLSEVNLINSWEEIVGKAISSQNIKNLYKGSYSLCSS